jgi:hypothetical protein
MKATELPIEAFLQAPNAQFVFPYTTLTTIAPIAITKNDNPTLY